MPFAPKRPCSRPSCPNFQPCPQHSKSSVPRDTKTGNERTFYNSTTWKRLRELHRSEEPFCRLHLSTGEFVHGELTDHIVAIRDDGDPLDWFNLQTLCNPCHARKRQEERLLRFTSRSDIQQRRFPTDIPRSRIPVTMVCGPPGSGKSTYLREHVRESDLVIDLDQIGQELSGLPEHHTGLQWLAPSLDERNRLLRSLSTERRHARAWFVISAPDPIERKQWTEMLGAVLIELRTPLAECIRRINADPARRGETHRMIQTAKAWWAINN